MSIKTDLEIERINRYKNLLMKKANHENEISLIEEALIVLESYMSEEDIEKAKEIFKDELYKIY